MPVFFINQEFFFSEKSSRVVTVICSCVCICCSVSFDSASAVAAAPHLPPTMDYPPLSVSSIVRPQMLIGHCGTNDSSVPFNNFAHIEFERNIKTRVKNKLSVVQKDLIRMQI